MTIYLKGQELASKFGFSEGNLLSEWWDDKVAAHRIESITELPVDPRDLLYRLVQRYLVPYINAANAVSGKEIGIYWLTTSHNPARLEIVNDREVWNDSDYLEELFTEDDEDGLLAHGIEVHDFYILLEIIEMLRERNDELELALPAAS